MEITPIPTPEALVTPSPSPVPLAGLDPETLSFYTAVLDKLDLLILIILFVFIIWFVFYGLDRRR